ncbi:S4 domain-containing protein YaaA [Thomasclavelia sp.]|uniref:S4 domain-containing protein YaaA n=1 Tax=Thomasclavelia sp. TaxID=3025757 RepID=UPI0025E75FC5|nr:S4 domain-containing protein YaaA [Thomasclavelia sp.]
MKTIQIKNEYITLGQFLKYTNCVSSGAEAKAVIQGGLVLVNGEVETRRGKKLRTNDQIEYNGASFVIG